MNYLSDWSALGVGPNVPQGLNSCDTWIARVQGGSAGSVPIMPPGLTLTTATDLGGGTMVLTGIYAGTATTAPPAFVDAQGGPAWRVLAFTPSANPSLTWNDGQQQCLPTVGFNPGGGASAGNPAKPAQPGTPAPLPPPVQVSPPVKAPAPVTGASSSSTNTVWIVAGLATAAGLAAWALR